MRHLVLLLVLLWASTAEATFEHYDKVTKGVGDTAYANVYVVYARSSDSTVVDTATTDSLGNYTVTLPDGCGLYNVTYDPADAAATTQTNVGICGPTSVQVNVIAAGATCNGVADDTAKIQAALDSLTNGGTLYIPAGATCRAVGLTIPTSGIAIVGDSPATSIIKKNGNGTLLTVSSKNNIVLDNFQLDGEGGTYTGDTLALTCASSCVGGISNSSKDMRISRMEFRDHAGYAVSFRDAGAGVRFVMWSSLLSPTLPRSIGQVEFPSTADTGGLTEDNYLGYTAQRMFTNINGDGEDFGNLDACGKTYIVSSYFNNLTMSDLTAGVSIIGNRWRQTSGTLAIKGDEGVFAHNIMDASITIDANSSNWTLTGNVISGTITNNASSDTITILEQSKMALQSWLDWKATSGLSNTANLWLTVDSDNNASNNGVVIAKNAGTTSATKMFEVNENGQVILYDGQYLRLYEDDANGSDTLDIKAASSMSASYAITWPAAAPSTGNCLTVSGVSGSDVTLAWSTCNP